MSEGVKSSLVVNQNIKKQNSTVLHQPPVIEYKQMNGMNDYSGELSDEQKEAEFNRQHEEYIKMKMQRKQELIRIKKQEFGTSSSDEHESSSDGQIDEPKSIHKVESKKSKGKIQSKNSIHKEETIYFVVLELKKLTIDTEVKFIENAFEINKKTIPFDKVNKVNLTACESKLGRRLKIGIFGSQDLVMFCPNTEEKQKDKSQQLFLQFIRYKLQNKQIKLTPLLIKHSSQQFSQVSEGALIFDKLLKKSQIIGTWQQRFIVIKPDGLYSYRSLKAKPTMFISLKEVKQFQTQFQIFKECLVCKLVYNNKTDFGLPLDQHLRWVDLFSAMIV